MNRYSIIALLAFSMGCEGQNPDQINLEYTGTLEARTNGVILFENNEQAFAGMASMACSVSTETGETEIDIDLPGEDDEVLDGEGSPGEGTVVLTSNQSGVYLLENVFGELPEAYMYTDDLDNEWNPDYPMVGVQSARLTDKGFVALRSVGDNCSMEFVDFGGQEDSVLVGSGACEANSPLVVSQDGSRAFVNTNDGLTRVTVDGSTLLNAKGNRLAWSEGEDTLFVGEQNSAQAAIVNTAGEQVSSVVLPGPLFDVKPLPNTNQFAITAKNGHRAVFATIDANGNVLSETDIPEVGYVEISSDGRQVAFVLPQQVHFFDMF